MFAGVGERTREGNDLYREMIESGVIKLGDKQVLICAPILSYIFSHLGKSFLLHLLFMPCLNFMFDRLTANALLFMVK